MPQSYQAVDKFNADIKNPPKGEHLWIAMAMYRIKPEIRGQEVILDRENLLSIEGPGCYLCEAVYGQHSDPCSGNL